MFPTTTFLVAQLRLQLYLITLISRSGAGGKFVLIGKVYRSHLPTHILEG